MLRTQFAILLTVALSTPAQTESKEYSEAVRLKDPVNKLVALEKFVADYPNGNNFLRTAYAEILKLRLNALGDPASGMRIRSYRAFLEDAIPKIPTARGQQSSFVMSAAEEFLDANLPPKESEFWARRALALVNENDFKASLRTSMQNLKPPPADSYYEAQIASFKAQRLAVIGRALIARGKYGQAQEHFEQSLKLSTSEISALNGLAQIADRNNKPKEALDYSASAVLSGKPKPEVSAIFNRRIGTQDREAFLDNLYKTKFPNPIPHGLLVRNQVQAQRVVLAEVFTGAGCPPCVAADLAFDGVLETYAPTEVAVLMYHVHVPRPDPLSNPGTVARAKHYDVKGVPSYSLDGKTAIGGGSREMTEDFFTALRPKLDAALANPTQGTLKIDMTAAGKLLEVKVQTQTSGQPNQKLWIALAEKQVRYSGENGVRFHPLVVRAMKSFDVQPAESASNTAVFDLDEIQASLKTYLEEFEESNERFGKIKFLAKPLGLSPANMTAVAFLEDSATKTVLSTVMLAPKAAAVTP